MRCTSSIDGSTGVGIGGGSGVGGGDAVEVGVQPRCRGARHSLALRHESQNGDDAGAREEEEEEEEVEEGV